LQEINNLNIGSAVPQEIALLSLQKTCTDCFKKIFSKPPLNMPRVDFRDLPEKNKKYLNALDEGQCYHYAFYLVHEYKAMLSMIPFESSCNATFLLYPKYFIKQLGYCETNTPVQGDLVLYLGDPKLDNNIRFKHLGVMTERGTIKSCWGNFSCELEHMMHQVPDPYGSEVVVLHKNSPSPENFDKIVETTSQASDFIIRFKLPTIPSYLIKNEPLLFLFDTFKSACEEFYPDSEEWLWKKIKENLLITFDSPSLRHEDLGKEFQAWVQEILPDALTLKEQSSIKPRAESSFIPTQASLEKKSSNLAQTQLSNFINFTDQAILKPLLGKDFQSDIHLSKAAEIAARIYEADMRGVAKTSNYGFVFPMDPEILAYAMQQAKNEIVLEIAGASGENSILLAFSGAERVYINDIEPLEGQTFQKLKEELPLDVSKKLEFIEGSCFDLLEKKPEISNKVGLILCRNLIRFFNQQQQSDFFQLLKKMLKPGGLAIFTTNAAYSFTEHRKVFEENPNSTSFATAQCFLTDDSKGTLPYDRLYHDISVCPDHLVSATFTNTFLYIRNEKTGYKWEVKNDAFNTLDPVARKIIKKAVLERKKEIASIPSGNLKVLKNTLRVYTKKTLPDLLKKHGFAIESTFVVAENGHLVDNADPFENGKGVGVIVRYTS
jgi:SAM-dependent methyltransferase